MNLNLAQKRCIPCEGGQPPLLKKETDELLQQLETPWQIIDLSTLRQEFTFKDFKDALSFVNKVGAIAEDEGHHPDIELHWGKVVIGLTTHAIGGLSQNDFILARKIELIDKSVV
jgi:4a-hydroxytetrahydrobiopterin dehydratase